MIEAQIEAVRLHGPGDPARLALERIPTPQPGAREVLVASMTPPSPATSSTGPRAACLRRPPKSSPAWSPQSAPESERVAVGEEVYALLSFDRLGSVFWFTERAGASVLWPSSWLASTAPTSLAPPRLGSAT